MPNISSFGAQTDNAVVQGTVTDRQMIIPEVPPQGLMSVGPRVTPNFVKPREWNAQTTYHFFDAVRDTAGNAYIATKPVVPEGTPLANENYWFLWADPDTRFDDLNETVKTFNQRITQNANDIATKAPINHASEETVYGIGNSLNYGHLKLATDDTPMTSDANAGVAATPQTVIKLSNTRSIEFYGCNSQRDCTEEFTRALNDASKNGICLYVPAKTYQLTGPIELPWNLSIIGENTHLSKLHFTNGIGFVSPVDKNGYKTTVNLYFANLKVEGDATYSTTENGIAFKGFFINYIFDNVNILRFNTAFDTRMPFGIDVYNEKYNMVYGDMRELRHIDIGLCNFSMKWYAPDTFFNGLDIHNTQNVGHIQGSVVNAHFWGFKGNIACLGVWANIEIESNIETTVLFQVEDNLIISNLHVYNYATETQILFNTPSKTPIVLMASNVFIEQNVANEKAFNMQLCNGNLTGQLMATISPKFTSTYKTTMADLMGNTKMLFSVLVNFTPIGEQLNIYKQLNKSVALVNSQM